MQRGWIQEFEMGGGGGANSYTPSQKGGSGGIFIEFRSKGEVRTPCTPPLDPALCSIVGGCG